MTLAFCFIVLGVAALWNAPALAQEPAEPPLKSEVQNAPPAVGAAAVLTDTTVLLPLVFDEQAFPPGKVSFVPVITNGTFDGGKDVGWTWTQNGVAYPLIYPTNALQLPSAIPPAATPSYLAWLGGDPRDYRDDRLSQTIQLPSDYTVRLRFDYFTASAEPVCNADPNLNRDRAALYVGNNAGYKLAEPAFALCRGGVSAGWTERTLDLSQYRGQKVTIQFRVETTPNFNSNLYLDNIELCGLSGDLSLPQQCAFAGWQETTAGSATRGGVSRTNGKSSMPSLAISNQGRPFLAWADLTQGNSEIYIRRWDGLLWQEMSGQSASGGGISKNGGESTAPSVAAAPNGAVYVAWQDTSSGNSDIYVRWWNGAAWNEVGGGSASGGGVSYNSTISRAPSIAVASTGVPYVAWSDQRAGVGEIFVKRWNGSYWEEVEPGSAGGGGISNNEGESTDPVLAAGDDGTIYVAWSDAVEGGDSEIYMRKYKQGDGWSDVGLGSSTGGGISNNLAASYSPALAVGPGGRLYLAWVDESDDNDTEIYARLWDGSSWKDMGGDSARRGGISNNGAPSQDPSVAVDRFNRAIVAWGDQSSGRSEIYLKRWNGAGWEDVGGSSGGGGISSSGTFSYEPSAAVGPDGTPYAAWSAVSSSVQIYIRRYMLD